MSEFERAWRWREERGLFRELGALRAFHGPGEGEGPSRRLAIDRFGDHYWVTEWEQGGGPAGGARKAAERAARFLESRGALSVVALLRPEKGVPEAPVTLAGSPPADRIEVDEQGARYGIRLQGVRHPGLFLDHLPLRQWLRARAAGWRTLNTFAYTGSLSVAAGLGGAGHVTTLDLSGATTRWAEENWRLNGLAEERGRFIAGDVFEWLPRLKREGRAYDCVILDPPSFSRGKKGSFSTSKDLRKLHELALDILAPRGVLVTSINSASVPKAKYEADVAAAAKEKGVALEVLWEIGLPETFPTLLGRGEDRYLKGWVLRSR